MKTFLLLAFSFSIALAQAVNAEIQDQDQVKAPKTRSQVQTPKHVAPQHVGPQHVGPQHVGPQHVGPQHVGPQRVGPQHVGPQYLGPQRTTVSKVPRINQTTVQANQYHPKAQSPARIHREATIPRADVPRMPPTVQADNDVPNKNWQNNNNQNTRPRKKNWQNRTVNNHSWEEARRRHHRHHHHRDWWRSRYSRFALFCGGYYFWDGGYWLPAYGYSPAYNSYAYDEPIYGYNDLDPAQVIASVQTELQRLGYYRYAVDGQMGPATRAAIANYQRDRGLSITSAIDGPTLQSLGLD